VQLQLDKPITAGRLNTHAASSDPRSATMSRRRSCLHPPTDTPPDPITESPDHQITCVILAMRSTQSSCQLFSGRYGPQRRDKRRAEG
jgi:hypothetical protein